MGVEDNWDSVQLEPLGPDAYHSDESDDPASHPNITYKDALETIHGPAVVCCHYHDCRTRAQQLATAARQWKLNLEQFTEVYLTWKSMAPDGDGPPLTSNPPPVGVTAIPINIFGWHCVFYLS